jgi:hypothetical protein
MAVTGVRDADGAAKGVNFWFYHAHGDAATGIGYFADALGIGMTENDLIYVPDGSGGVPVLGYVSAAGTLTSV